MACQAALRGLIGTADIVQYRLRGGPASGGAKQRRKRVVGFVRPTEGPIWGRKWGAMPNDIVCSQSLFSGNSIGAGRWPSQLDAQIRGEIVEGHVKGPVDKIIHVPAQGLLILEEEPKPGGVGPVECQETVEVPGIRTLVLLKAVDVARQASLLDGEIGDDELDRPAGVLNVGVGRGEDTGVGVEAVAAGILIALGSADRALAAPVGSTARRVAAADRPRTARRAVVADASAPHRSIGLEGAAGLGGTGLEDRTRILGGLCGRGHLLEGICPMISPPRPVVKRVYLGYCLGNGRRIWDIGGWQAGGGVSCPLTPFWNGGVRPAAGVGGPHRINPQEQTKGHDQEQRDPAFAPAGPGVPLSRAAAWRCDNKDEQTEREKQGSSWDLASIDRAASLASAQPARGSPPGPVRCATTPGPGFVRTEESVYSFARPRPAPPR